MSNSLTELSYTPKPNGCTKNAAFHFNFWSCKTLNSNALSHSSRCTVRSGCPTMTDCTFGRTSVCRAALLHVIKCFKSPSSVSVGACMLWHRLVPRSHSRADGNENLRTVKLWEHVRVFRSVCVCWANSYQTGAETLHLHPAITSTGLFLPVGWFLPLRSLHFLHAHISLQQQYNFLNLAQVLWTLWTSNNSSSISLSLAHSLPRSFSDFLCPLKNLTSVPPTHSVILT